MAQIPERRTTRMGLRAGRIAGGMIGAAIAVIVAWSYKEYTGRGMPPDVSGAIGGLAATCIICVDDLRAFLLALFNRRQR